MAHILIAEDEIGQAHLLATLCKLWGHTSTIAGNGEEALEILDREAFDLLLVDARMPFLDGITLTYVLRKGRMYAQLPIIGMTALATAEQAEFWRAGVDAVVEKPYEIEVMRGAIEQVLAAGRKAG
jgi:two-component system sensor histidine kinase RpfC